MIIETPNLGERSLKPRKAAGLKSEFFEILLESRRLLLLE